MDTFELKKEQQRLAEKVEVRDRISRIKTIGGVTCVVKDNSLIASVVVCEYPSMKCIENKTYTLSDPLPFRQGFQAYREMPAMVEAINLLEEDPDILLVRGVGIAHPRKIGLASHLGLILNIPTIGVVDTLPFGTVEEGKIFLHDQVVGFEVKTREHSNPVFVSPGHLVSLGSCINTIKETIQYPHKMPEPLHMAKKMGRKAEA